MEHKKILIIEDLISTQDALKSYYDKENISYEICKNFMMAYEKINNIVKNNTASDYEYILMDGELNGYHTDKLIEELLIQENVPPIISISAQNTHTDKYKIPYADKLGLLDNLKFVLGVSNETFLDSHLGVMEGYRELFNKRDKNSTIRHAILTILQDEEKKIGEEKNNISQDIVNSNIFQRLSSFFKKGD